MCPFRLLPMTVILQESLYGIYHRCHDFLQRFVKIDLIVIEPIPVILLTMEQSPGCWSQIPHPTGMSEPWLFASLNSVKLFSDFLGLFFFFDPGKTKKLHKAPWFLRHISVLVLCCSSPLLLIRSSQIVTEKVTVMPPDCNLSRPPKNLL